MEKLAGHWGQRGWMSVNKDLADKIRSDGEKLSEFKD